MNAAWAPSYELADLVDAVCSDRITTKQTARLEQLVLADAKARRYYVRYLHVHASLPQILSAHEDMEFDGLCGTGEASNEELAEESASPSSSSAMPISMATDPTSPQEDSLPAYGFAGNLWHGAIGFFSQEIPFSLLIASLVTGLGLLAGSMIYVSQPQPIAKTSPSLMPTVGRPALEREIVGRVTGMVDCQGPGVRGQGSVNTNLKSPVSLGDKFAISSGLMEIAYDTGAKVILQGPVAYEVDSRDGGFLSVGKLTARLEKKGAEVRDQGSKAVNQKSLASSPQPLVPHADPSSRSPFPSSLFTIKTPTATVTDLGTEFGVEVDKSGHTDTQVFVGTVRIASLNEQGNETGQSQTIRAGQYARVGKNLTITSGRLDSEKLTKQFARTMPQPLNTGDAYAKLVLSMNPVVYYRMDQWPASGEKNRYVLVDSAPGGHHGVACLDEAFGKPSGQGKFGGALDLHGSMGVDYAFVKNYPKPENGQLSVSAWVWAVSLDPWASIVVNCFAPPSYTPTIGQFGFGVGGKFELGVGVRQQDGKVVEVCELGKPLPCSQWQHVAFVADGAVLHLYRNGMEVGTAAPYRGIARPPLPECLSIGCEMDKDGTRPRPENAFVWNGRIDEIAIFNHALSAEQVRRLSAERTAAAGRRTNP